MKYISEFALVAIVFAFILLASAYSGINPLFESPDEVWHYEYVRWLAEGRGLAHPDDVGHAPWHQEGSQPPLYYLSAAALTAWIPTDNAPAVIRYNPHAAIGQSDAFGNKNMMAHGAAEAWPWRGVALAAHLARFFSIALGAVTVACTYATARTVFPARGGVAIAAAALVAFNPQFLFLSAAVNNDNLVTACSAVGIWFAVVLLGRREPDSAGKMQQAAPTTWQLLAFGALTGIGALSKLSGLLLCLLVALTLTMIAWRRRIGWEAFVGDVVRWGLISGGTALLVAGWWFVRNWLLFGDPLALQAMFAILPRRPAPPTLAELLARAPGVWRSMWAVFGWFNVVADEWLYRIYTIISLVAIVGFLLTIPLQRLYSSTRQSLLATRHQTAADFTQRWQIALLLLWIALIVLSLLRWAQMRYPQGRLLYPALSALAVILGCGLLNWFPPRWQRGAASGLSAVLLILAILAPWRWIAPTYAAPAPLPASTELSNPVAVSFGEQMQLRGYRVSAEELRPGDTLDVELFWQAQQPLEQDYSVFIHLVDDNEIVQAQRDSYPGLGNFPTSEWPSDALIPDRHRLTIPATVPTPARLRIDVGLYDYVSRTRLPVGDSDVWTLGYLTLLAPAGESDLPHSVSINFDDQIALVGFEFDRRVMQPGETLGLTLWWEALTVPADDYKVFTHLVLPPEATWAQMDSRPQRGGARTDTWQPGQRIEDHYELTLPPSAPPGVYFVEIGIYDPDTNDRLPVNFSDKGIVLGQVRVEAGGGVRLGDPVTD